MISNIPAMKPTPTTLTLEDMISDENIGIGRIRAEIDNDSWELLETVTALSCSVRYEQMKDRVKAGIKSRSRSVCRPDVPGWAIRSARRTLRTVN